MRRGVPFACQRRPIVGVLRMCWLLLGSFDCVCCPHTSLHRPPIACLAVFLCGPGAFLHALSGPSTICPFPPHGWSAPDGLPLLLRKQPIWAAGDTPHLMPVEQGLPWHPVATGLAGQAIPFIVAASHAHDLPSAPFWFSVPAVPVASPALLCVPWAQCRVQWWADGPECGADSADGTARGVCGRPRSRRHWRGPNKDRAGAGSSYVFDTSAEGSDVPSDRPWASPSGLRSPQHCARHMFGAESADGPIGPRSGGQQPAKLCLGQTGVVRTEGGGGGGLIAAASQRR